MASDTINGKVNSKARIGQQCNLIEGLAPSWWNGESNSPVMEPLQGQTLSVEDVPDLSHERWIKHQKISLCKNWSQFIAAFFADFNTGGRGGAHVYALQQPGSDAVGAFANWLGISPALANDNSGCGFALVRKFKQTVIQTPTDAFDGAEQLLSDIVSSSSSHKQMLDYFSDNGTHVLSSITWGDVFGQVFVYDKEHFDAVEDSFPEDMRTGGDSGFFRNFTQLRDEDYEKGYVKEAGKLWLASGDPDIADIAKASVDPVNGLKESFFQVISNPEVSKNLYAIETVTATGFALAPIVDQLLPVFSADVIDDGEADIKEEDNKEIDSREDQSSVSCPVELARIVTLGNLSEANGRFHRYGEDGAPDFDKKVWPDYAEIYQDFQPEVVSRACTKRMSVKRPFVNLDTLAFEFPLYQDHVEDFIVIADVIQVHRQNIYLPGNNITLICHRLVCGNEGNTAPSMRLSQEAYDSFTIYTEEMRGTLSIVNRDAKVHRTLADGEIVESNNEQEEASIVVTGRIDDPLPLDYFKLGENWHADNLLEGLEYGLLATETILGFASGDARQVARDNAIWMSRILSEDEGSIGEARDPRYRALKLRAQTAFLTDRYNRPIFVPAFSFSAYKPKIDALLKAIATYDKEKSKINEAIRAELSEQERRASEKTMNENLQSIGAFLADQAVALSKHEDDVSKEIDKLDEEQQETLNKLNKKLPTQLATLQAAQKNFSDAHTVLKKALEDYVIKEAIWTAIDLTMSLGSVMVNVGSIGDFTGKLAKTVQDTPEKFQKLVSILQKIEGFLKLLKVFIDIYDNISDLVGLAGVGDNDLNELIEAYAMKDGASVLPTNADWTDFEIELSVMTSGLPSEVSAEKAKFIAAGKRMSIAAKAWSSTQGKIIEVGLERVRLDWKRQVSDGHRDRMEALSKTIQTKDLPENERANIDLFGISAYFEGQASALRLSLAKTLLEYDAALQYFYFYKAKPITRYDLASLYKAMVDRSGAALKGFSPAEHRPTNVDDPLVVKLPRSSVAELRSAEGLNFDVCLNHPAFLGFIRVRILEVRVKVSGVSSPETNRYFFSLLSQNFPLHDRGLSREALDFESVPFRYNYVHNTKDDKPHATNRISSRLEASFNDMTPFTNWKLTLPERGDNVGLVFDEETCDIELEFYVNAAYTGFGASSNDQEHVPRTNQLQRKFSRGPAQAKAAAGKSIAKLMGEMSGKSVTNDWDAVCLLDMEKVNNLFAQRYEKEIAGAVQTLAKNITLPQFVYTSDYDDLEEEENKADVDLTVGPPKIQLLGDGSIRASVYMDVLSGTIRRRRYERERDSKNDPWGEWEVTKDRTQDIEPDKNAIRCDVNLQKLRGRANKALSIDEEDYRVVVNLGEGTFATSVDMDGPIATMVTSELKKYFTALESHYDYCLGVAKWDLPHTPKPLRPKSFEFTTRVFEGSNPESPKGVLVMLINTESQSSKPPRRNDVDLDNDQLLAEDKTASLIISSRLIFQDLIYPQIQGKWAHTSNGYSARISPSSGNDGKAVILQGEGQIYIGTSSSGPDLFNRLKERDTLIPLDGFRAEGVMQKLKITWEQAWHQEFAYYNSSGFGAPQIYGTDFQLSLEKEAVLKVKTVNGKPVLEIASISLNPSVTYTKPDIYRQISEALLPQDIRANVVLAQLQRAMNEKLPAVTINLGDLSLFAVSNLLFPGAKVLSLEENSAYLPGDLWIIGDVADQYREF